MGERSFSKSWCLRASGSFVPLPLPRHSFFFCSCPSFLDEPREETLATQATARQLFRPRLMSSVTRNTWRENANPDSLLKDGYLSLDKQNRDNQMPQKGRLRSFTRGSDYRDLTGKILVFLVF